MRGHYPPVSVKNIDRYEATRLNTSPEVKSPPGGVHMVPTRPLAALLVAATAAALLTSAQLPAAAAATTVQVYWSSESRTAGYEPKNGNWYTNPATGLAGTPYQLSRQADATIGAASGSATINVDTNTQYQTMLGVGSSLEEKTSNNIIGGSLNSSQIPTLATYYRRAVQAYTAQGIPIYALTLQNEPLFSPADYPGMLVSADQERQLAKALRTELNGNGFGTTRIWAFDHNFSEGASYAAWVLGSGTSHSDAYSSVDGIAFHDYAGEPTAMAQVKSTYPDKDVLMTERSVWGTSGADRIVQYFRNSATLYEGWVSMLDQNRTPERWSGSPDPTMLVQSTANRDTFWALPDYNMTAQFSKFVQAGAKRVATGYGSTGTVTNVAFMNPDGTLVTVVVNQTGANQAFTLRVGGQQISSTLPAKTVGTYLWAGASSGTGTSHIGPIVGYGGKCVDVAGASTANGAK